MGSTTMAHRRGKTEFEPDEPDVDPALATIRAEEPDADTIEQHQDVIDEDDPEPDELLVLPDAPEADALEQRQPWPPRDQPGRP